VKHKSNSNKERIIIMSMKECCTTNEEGASVTVTVDVTKIVKYVCFTAVIVVGIIFGTRCCHKMMEEGYFDQKCCRK
jgi:hypothetical protein